MTPLAQEIVRLDLAGADWVTGENPWPGLTRSDCRCFEVSAVLPLMRDLVDNDAWSAARERLAFLPAPVTWIEWHQNPMPPSVSGRVGVLLTAIPGGTHVEIEGISHHIPHDGYLMRYCARPDGGHLPRRVEGCDPIAMYPNDVGEMIFAAPPVVGRDARVFQFTVTNMRMAAAALALINTPRIVGRKTHLPHAGLQREMARKRKMVGKFPLQAWTEVTLDLTPPKEAQDDGHEAHLSGGKALHFCRAYLRLRNGQVEFVRHHWRGDPSLGLRRSRYVLKPSRAGAIAA